MANISPTILLAAVSISFIVFYKYIIFPIVLSPLAKVPSAHWSASLSSFWINYHRLHHHGTFIVHEAHQKYGPVIRLAPNELSINCVDGGLRQIYAGGYEKQQWYDIFKNYDVAPMFAMDNRHEHSKRKRMVSNIYAKSFLQANQSLAAISKIMVHDRLVPILERLEARDEATEFMAILSAFTMDFVCAYTMGLKNGSNFLADLQYAKGFNHVFHELQKDMPWAQELPFFTSIVTALHLESFFTLEIPGSDKYKAEDMVMDMCDRAEVTMKELETSSAAAETKLEDYPTVYAQLRQGLLSDAQISSSQKGTKMTEMCRKEIASELLDHTMAGYDTSSITLTYLAWQLSKTENAGWQKKLFNELHNVTDDPRTLDSMPVLHAILMETLRLNTAIPGNQPRVTPANAKLGPPGQVYSLPANVRVQAQAYSLHRQPDVFPEPDSWLPDRWISSSDEQKKEMLRWFWAFGSGGRMCVGSNLAMIQMKLLIKAIWSNFSTTIDFDEGMSHLGGYMAPPVGKDGKTLMLRLKKRSV